MVIETGWRGDARCVTAEAALSHGVGAGLGTASCEFPDVGWIHLRLSRGVYRRVPRASADQSTDPAGGAGRSVRCALSGRRPPRPAFQVDSDAVSPLYC